MTNVHTRRCLNIMLSVLTLLSASFSSYAAAQGEESVIEEVVVTATKRQADEFDIPIAMDTISNAEIENSGVVDLVDLPLLSPSLAVSAPTAWVQPFIRGVGSLAPGMGHYSSVAIYVDGVYQANPLALNTATLENAESIQVLKGPQGTLYGRNATAGTILINTHTPKVGDDFSAFAQVDVGDYGTQKFLGRASFGLGDKAAGSLTASIRERDGFVENRGSDDLGDLGDEDAWSVNGKLAFEPTDRLSLVLGGSYREDDTASMPHNQIAQFTSAGSPFPGLNNPQALWAGTVFQFVQGGVLAGGGTQADADAAVAALFPSVFGMASQIDFLNGTHETADNTYPNNGFTSGLVSGSVASGSTNYLEDTQFHLNATYSFDTFDVVAISGFHDAQFFLAADALRANPATLPDLTTIGLPALFNQGNIGYAGVFETEVFTQEVYAVSTDGPLEWIVGVYYFDDSGDINFTFDALGTSTLLTNNEYQVESISAYAEVTYPLSDTLGLTAGLRYTDEEVELDDNLFGQPLAPNVGKLSISDDQITYNLKLTYTTEDLLVYGGVSTGFKSAALNTGNPNAGRVDAEEVTSYEVGFKSKHADGRVQLSGAAFVYDLENMQLNIVNFDTGQPFLTDGVEADVAGIELGVEAQLTDTLGVFANATWLDTEYLNDATIVGSTSIQFIEGNELTQAPDLVVSFGLNYFQSLASGASIGARLLGNHNGGSWADQTNSFGTGGLDDDGFVVVNASVSFTDASDRWTITGYVNNLFDEEYYTGGQEFAGGLSLNSLDGNPRHYGLRVRFDI